MITTCLPRSERNSLKILLVEDNVEDAELIEELLLEPSFIATNCITKVTRVGEAIEALNQEVFDVILLDLSLPDSQGFDSLARVAEYSPKTPIIVLTACNDRELALQLLQAGAQDYLVKTNINNSILILSLQLAIERKKSRETIQKMEELASFQQAVLNSTNYAIIGTTINGTIHTFNTAAQQLLGYQSAEVIGIATPAILHDPQQIRERARELSQKLNIAIEPGFEVLVAKARRGETDEREWTYIRKDGARFPVLLSVTPIGDGFGNITGFLGIARDITKDKQTEAALHFSEERLQMALEGSGLGMWDWNIRTGKTYFDSQWKKMLGYESWEIENNYQAWEQLLHPEDLPRVLQILNDHLQGYTDIYEVEFRIKNKSGNWQWILSQGKIFNRDELGNPVRMLGTNLDISERKAAEEENLKLTDNLQEAQRIAHIGNWEFDVTNGTIAWSDELFRIFGCKPGKPPTFTQLVKQVYQEDRDSFLQVLETAMTEGIPYDIDYRIYRFDEKLRYINSKGKALLSNSGRVLRLFGTAMDITERKQAEEALQQQVLRERLVNVMQERIRQSLNLQEVLTTAVKEVQQFLQTDRAIVYRFHSDRSGVVVVESVIEGWIPTLGIDIQSHCSHQNEVLIYQENTISAIEDIDKSGLSECQIEFLKHLQIKAAIVVPIRQGKNLWGLLMAHHCSSPRQWLSSEIESLKQLSVQLAIAIQQSILFEQAKNEIIERKTVEIALRQSEARERSKALQLEITLHKLKSTQAQLVHNEKMAGLGQLVAGIAHEINNPVSFIYGNISPAIEYASSLTNLIKLYQKYYPKPPIEISDEIENIELDFITQDFQRLLGSMQEGAKRIKEIVLSLRNFSRLEEAESKQVDLHSGIDSTLLILQHRLKEQPSRVAIEVIKNYGKLPKVDCYPGQLNQVFMNILNNAIDALEQKISQDSSVTPQISIITETVTRQDSLLSENEEISNERILIRIIDNGPGIPSNVKQRLFDPFFTTKPVGKGTGLGLSISYQIIVEKHHGTLRCNSELGHQTEFAIEIPLKPTSPN
ncbi:MAG TPA: PAS domain S-box protein [Leptolyngbyaceae cyanobacterium]